MGWRHASGSSTLFIGRGATRSCEAPPIRHGNCRDTFPSGDGFPGWLSSGGAPLRSPRFAHACALRLRGRRRRPPAEADGGYSCSSGHAPLRRTAPFLTCPSTPADKPRNARQAHHPARNEGGPPVPPGSGNAIRRQEHRPCSSQCPRGHSLFLHFMQGSGWVHASVTFPHYNGGNL